MKSVRFESVTAWEIFDGRGEPTLRVTALLEDGSAGTAAVPSGDPEETRPTVELRDGDVRRYGGRGVRKAVKNVNAIIAPALEGGTLPTLREVDHILCRLDSTPNCSRLGANALLGASLACARALAAHYHMELARFLGGEGPCRLPVPTVALPLDSPADCRGLGLVPVGAQSLGEGLAWCRDIARGFSAEGCATLEQLLDRAASAVERAGCAGRVKLSLAAGAGDWLQGDHYRLPRMGAELTTEELMATWEELAERFPLFSLEDPLGPGDAESWAELNLRLGSRVQLAGEELFAPDPDRLLRELEGACGAAILHPHRAGTVTGLLRTVDAARSRGWRVILAPAPGETEDDFPADLAVACGVGQIKLGPLRGAERLSKVNRLLALEAGA